MDIYNNNSKALNRQERKKEVYGVDTLRKKKVYFAMMEYMKRYRRVPDVEEIASIVDMPASAVQNILSKMQFTRIAHPLRVLTNDVLMSIYQSARRGTVEAQKLWMQLFEGYSPKDGMPEEVADNMGEFIKSIEMREAQNLLEENTSYEGKNTEKNEEIY